MQISPARPFHFGPTLNIKGTLMLRVVQNKEQETTGVTDMEFYKHDQLFLLLNHQERPPGKYFYQSSVIFYL